MFHSCLTSRRSNTATPKSAGPEAIAIITALAPVDRAAARRGRLAISREVENPTVRSDDAARISTNKNNTNKAHRLRSIASLIADSYSFEIHAHRDTSVLNSRVDRMVNTPRSTSNNLGVRWMSRSTSVLMSEWHEVLGQRPKR